METKSKYAPQNKWAKSHTKQISLKFNLNTDADILQALEGKAAQTEIKRLIRIALEHEQK